MFCSKSEAVSKNAILVIIFHQLTPFSVSFYMIYRFIYIRLIFINLLKTHDIN